MYFQTVCVVVAIISWLLITYTGRNIQIVEDVNKHPDQGTANIFVIIQLIFMKFMLSKETDNEINLQGIVGRKFSVILSFNSAPETLAGCIRYQFPAACTWGDYKHIPKVSIKRRCCLMVAGMLGFVVMMYIYNVNVLVFHFSFLTFPFFYY